MHKYEIHLKWLQSGYRDIFMGKINEQHLLDEIRFDIEHKDIIKARLVLAELDSVGPETQKKALFEVSRAEDNLCIPLLAGVMETIWPLWRPFRR
jgi:hypothetical protein